MPEIHLHYLNHADVEALAVTDQEIIAAVESSLLAQGRGETTIEPRMHLVPEKEAARIVNQPENRKKFEGLGMAPVGNRPQELAATIEAETQRRVEVIRKQNIKVE